MSKIILSGNIKDVKNTKAGNTFITVWDNYTKRSMNGGTEQKSRTVVVWFDENLHMTYNVGDWIEVEGEPSASSFETTDTDTGAPKTVAMLNVNRPKVIQHRPTDAPTLEKLGIDEDDLRKDRSLGFNRHGLESAPF